MIDGAWIVDHLGAIAGRLVQHVELAVIALAVGFVWESADKYSGPLRIGRTDDEFQFILRRNLEVLLRRDFSV